MLSARLLTHTPPASVKPGLIPPVSRKGPIIACSSTVDIPVITELFRCSILPTSIAHSSTHPHGHRQARPTEGTIAAIAIPIAKALNRDKCNVHGMAWRERYVGFLSHGPCTPTHSGSHDCFFGHFSTLSELRTSDVVLNVQLSFPRALSPLSFSSQAVIGLIPLCHGSWVLVCIRRAAHTFELGGGQ